MKHIKQGLLAIFVAVTATMIASCANNPMGMSDEEWQLLTPEQQFEARKIQDARDEAARERRAAEKAQQAAALAELEYLRRNAPFGDVVQCTITNADGYFSKGEWFALQPVSVEMHRSESQRSVTLLRQEHSNSTIILQMGFDGLNVKACRQNNRNCEVLVGTEAQFRRGISRHINIHKTIEGTLFCSFPQRR